MSRYTRDGAVFSISETNKLITDCEQIFSTRNTPYLYEWRAFYNNNLYTSDEKKKKKNPSKFIYLLLL